MIVLRQQFATACTVILRWHYDGSEGGQYIHRFLFVGLCCYSMDKQKTTRMQKVGHQTFAKTQQLYDHYKDKDTTEKNSSLTMVADPAIASDKLMRRIQMSRHKFVEALKEWYFSVGRLTSEKSPNTTCSDPPRSKNLKPFSEIISSFLSPAKGKKQKYGRIKKAFSLHLIPHLYGARGKQFWSISLRSFGFYCEHRASFREMANFLFSAEKLSRAYPNYPNTTSDKVPYSSPTLRTHSYFADSIIAWHRKPGWKRRNRSKPQISISNWNFL